MTLQSHSDYYNFTPTTCIASLLCVRILYTVSRDLPVADEFKDIQTIFTSILERSKATVIKRRP